MKEDEGRFIGSGSAGLGLYLTIPDILLNAAEILSSQQSHMNEVYKPRPDDPGGY